MIALMSCLKARLTVVSTNVERITLAKLATNAMIAFQFRDGVDIDGLAMLMGMVGLWAHPHI